MDNIKIVQISKKDYQQEVELQPTPKRPSPPEYVMLNNNKPGNVVQDTVKDILGTDDQNSEEIKTHMAAICIFISAAVCLTVFIFYILRW